MYFCF